MKRYLLFAVLGLVALGAAADRFYIEDFEIAPGETMTVSILLENEATYTAFQTDIYLPEGLTVEQEDGDYIFDLTSRKSRNHNIASQLQVDGAIRVISYSPRINAYKDNSGALVTFNVIASADFTGPASIQLKNTLFTNTAGYEVAFVDEECTVTTPATGLVGDVDDDGAISIGDVVALIDYLLYSNPSTINIDNADVDSDGTISVADATALIDYLLVN
jgi:hypothetical protein